jgi:two-component system phosphate regulon sensor histidine kinase PhoR
MVGRRVWELTRIRAVSEVLAAVLARSGEVIREVRVVEGPREQILQLHAAPLSTGLGDPAGAVVVLHDITTERRLEETRRDFVANVSHELKTPLTAITALVETILDDDQMDPSVRARFLAKVRDQCARLTAMVRDLLDLSRIESGDIRPEFAPVDLRRTIRQAVSGVQEEAERRDVALTLELPAQPVKIMGDERALGRMLGNLLENAIKYTGKGGHVVVAATVTGGEVVVEVQDDGVGIEERHHSRIFERFYRVDLGRSREVGGTGLGLSIVKHVALAHDGRVGLRSSPGEGSTFQVVLPQSILPSRAG